MKILSDSKKLLLELLLKDTRISSEILLNGEIPESIKVHDDGSVTFYRSRQHWWSWLFQDKKTYEFRELSTMMLAAYSKYLPPNKYLNNILTQKVIEEAYKTHDYESVINRFALYAFLGVTEGDYKISKTMLIDDDPQQQQKMRVDKKQAHVLAILIQVVETWQSMLISQKINYS